MLTKASDKSPNKVSSHGRMNGISVYTPDENKWSNYVPLRKNHSTSKAEPTSKPLFQSDLENEFKKALDSMKRQKTEKRTTVSSTRVPTSKSTKGAISRLRQENNEKLNESLERSFNIKNSNLQTTGRSSRSINGMGGSSVASNMSNTHDLDISINKSLTGIDSPQLESSKKLKSKSSLQRDRSTSSIKESGKKFTSKSPISNSKKKIEPSPSPGAKSITSPKMLKFKTINSSDKIETPSKSPTTKGNIKKINSASSLNKTSQTLSKTKNSASQNKITPIKQKTAGDKLIGLLGPSSETRGKKPDLDITNTSGKKINYTEKTMKDVSVTDRLEKANADLKRKQEELALSYKKYALEKFISKLDKYFSHIFIGGKREGFIMILSEIQRQNIKITQFLTWQEETIKRSYFDQLVIYKFESKRREQEVAEKSEKFIYTKYTNKFFRLWKSTHSVKTPIDSRVNSVRQNSLDSIWNNKRESIDFDSSRRMGRINSSIDRLSLTKSGMIPTFSDSKIDKAPTLANSPANKDIDKIIDQSAEIFNSQLEHSFGCETIPRESVKTDKEQDTVLVGLSPGKESIKDDDDEAIPDQIITHIPKPITKEAAPVGQWSDKENRKSPFEKRDPKKSPLLKESKSKLNEMTPLRQSKTDLSQGNKLDKNIKKTTEKKPPMSKSSSTEVQSKATILEKDDPVLLERAKTHYNKRLLKIIGFAPLQRIWNKLRMQNLEAREFNKLTLIKKVFRILENGNFEPNETICSEKSNDCKRGEQHYELMLKINAFNSFLKNFVQSFEEAEAYNKIREDFIKRKVFTKWFIMKEELKADNDDSTDGYDGIIEKFRFIILAEKALKGFKKISDEEKLNKLKLAKQVPNSRKSPIPSAKNIGRPIKS